MPASAAGPDGSTSLTSKPRRSGSQSELTGNIGRQWLHGDAELAAALDRPPRPADRGPVEALRLPELYLYVLFLAVPIDVTVTSVPGSVIAILLRSAFGL